MFRALGTRKTIPPLPGALDSPTAKYSLLHWTHTIDLKLPRRRRGHWTRVRIQPDPSAGSALPAGTSCQPAFRPGLATAPVQHFQRLPGRSRPSGRLSSKLRDEGLDLRRQTLAQPRRKASQSQASRLTTPPERNDLIRPADSPALPRSLPREEVRNPSPEQDLLFAQLSDGLRQLRRVLSCQYHFATLSRPRPRDHRDGNDPFGRRQVS